MDVIHGVLDDVHLGQLLESGGGWYPAAERLKALVDSENSVPLTRVPLHGLEVLWRGDDIAVDRVDGNQPLPRRHRSQAEAKAASSASLSASAVG